MRTWYLLSVWLHLIAAAVWIGSMAFLGMVLVPVLRSPDLAPVRTRLLYRTGLHFRWIGWIVLAVLIGTGISNVGFRGYTWASLWNGDLWNGAWGHLLGVKVALVVLVLIVSAWHDFYLGPRATRLMEAAANAPEARRLRRTASWIGRMTLLLSLAILFLAVMLVRGTP